MRGPLTRGLTVAGNGLEVMRIKLDATGQYVEKSAIGDNILRI